ncbi:hypothetical protein N7491_003216 [Penicillium cf. griseofulvum]|uniref:Uncharacterized protein n=1 Tax=Penicillium cf. griseofulvum TaxID=2972120 RepID=A0A9W9T1N6_9EURO|nr:hypothetical protein N7472_002612 [Penicillium cf. griseofulvum]KAJ5440810.1 hypothetical protein N7491_003216 [Penicillium cf. griseofulvum]KAJ5448856.1 hypothetical protein N7445_003677 [Penicillium cf. griseofulvum]
MVQKHKASALKCMNRIMGPWDHGFATLSNTKEFVLAIPHTCTVEATGVGNCPVMPQTSGQTIFGFDTLLDEVSVF